MKKAVFKNIPNMGWEELLINPNTKVCDSVSIPRNSTKTTDS